MSEQIEQTLGLELYFYDRQLGIPEDWEEIEQFIEDSRARWDFLYTKEFLLDGILSGLLQLWNFRDKQGKLQAIMVTQIVEYPARKVLEAILAVGSGLHEGLPLFAVIEQCAVCLLYTSPSPRDRTRSRMPSSA